MHRSGRPAKNRFATHSQFPPTRVLVCAFCVLLCASAIGCKRRTAEKLTPSQIRQISEELAKAASDAAPKDSVIKINLPRAAGGPPFLIIDLPDNRARVRNRVRQALEHVAAERRLAMQEVSKNANSLIILRSSGANQPLVEIMIRTHAEESRVNTAGQARLAILLDDLGNDRNVAEAVFALHVPVTVSILPYKTHSNDIAQEARKRGCEVMLHLPMQSVGKEAPEQQQLRPGLASNQVRDIVTRMLQAIPEADGVNNHQGSQATSNGALMDALMPVLRDADVFYVDSRTTAETVAYDTAKRDGVKTAFRNVPFLDDVQKKAAIKRQLQIAIRGAKEKGEAIAIGHPHPETLQALREMLPEVKKQKVRLVFVSDVVH